MKTVSAIILILFFTLSSCVEYDTPDFGELFPDFEEVAV